MNADADTTAAAPAHVDAEHALGAARRTSPRAHLRQSLGWIAFGIVVVVLSWRMDRLERQDINPYTVPGLLPGCLGVATVFFGLLMLWRSWRELRAAPPAAALARTPHERREATRIVTVLVLCIGYAAGLMGHGLPFWLATSVFVAVAIGVLQFSERKTQSRLVRRLVFALGMGIAVGIVTTIMFQDLFLVRLP